MPEPDPTMRTVNLAEPEHSHKQQHSQREQAVSQPAAAQQAVIQTHADEHRAETDERPQALPDDVVILRAVLLQRDGRTCAIDHHDAKEREANGRRKQPLVRL